MGLNICEKLIQEHLVFGDMTVGNEIAIRIDQTLLQDALGTMTCLQFEEMDLEKVESELSAIYVDHNTLQTGFQNADDHEYLRSFAEKYGVYYSKPGNGICHQVHLENFAKPGKTLLGTDSHTPTCGGAGSLAIGAGGTDVAVCMSGEPFYFSMPSVVKIDLVNELKPGVSAKDIILKVLSIFTTKGGLGKVFEYGGEGIRKLSVYERATICNMGAELGATTSIFPSDAMTRKFLKSQGRESDFIEMEADPDATYESVVEIDLAALEPLIALPHSPDNIKFVKDQGHIKVDQVCIGSCTNSSYMDMMRVAAALKDKKVHEDVSLVISPGSKQILNALAKNGALADMISAGARILESACGPCIGMGQAPKSGGVSLRTFNRNFERRSGTDDAQVYLVSPETAVASAIAGTIAEYGKACGPAFVESPEIFEKNNNLLIEPSKTADSARLLKKGKNIKPFSVFGKLEENISGKILLKMGDDITTDHIMPGGAEVLPYRSNIPHLSKYCFVRCDKEFPELARKHNGGFVVGGINYGQGSSREHAVLVPVYLGVRVVMAKSFARIHRTNLINSGIIPLEFEDSDDYDKISQLDTVAIRDIIGQIDRGDKLTAYNETKDCMIEFRLPLSKRQKDIIKSGGMINYIKSKRNH